MTKIGLTPAAVLSQARVPVTVYDGKKNLVTTAQFFALWRAVGELSSDPAAGLKIATQIDVGNRPPSTMAAYYARARVKSAKSVGIRVGNWLSLRQAQALLSTPDTATMKGLSDRVILAVLLGCGLSDSATWTTTNMLPRPNRRELPRAPP